ncbi:optic atrophy 3 protein [Entomortierella parvispora]|uniref:Optic atrophy 3 protein n=1 Tax=Entomortierella parvispora TaxID=205924 RepID=A0A9P3H437_9FUNG|nr:optic atrophy 3 protein [Entomortierella parvispora]
MSAIKLGFLAIRTIAKPIANSIKSYSVKHPKFKEACIGVAQFSHKTEMQLKMKFLGYKVESIRPLNDARAVEMGANFLSEAFIFGVAGSLIILENARSRMNARDRKNHVDETLDNLLLMSEELREELKGLEIATEHKMDEMRKENVLLRKTLNEILDVSLRLRSHTPYTGQEIGIGNASGGFVLQIADEPMVRTFPADPSPPASSSSGSTVVSSDSTLSSQGSSSQSHNSRSSAATPLQSSYDFHHQHHQLGHPEHQDEYILIDQPQAALPPQPIKKSGWGSFSLPWSSSGSSGSPSSPSA